MLISGIDEKKYLKKTSERVDTAGENISTKGDYYGMNIATFTFGGKQPNGVANSHTVLYRQKESEQEDMSKKNNYRKATSSKKFDFAGDTELESEKEKAKYSKKDNLNYKAINQPLINNFNNPVPPIFLNKLGAHNSFLLVVLHSIWHLSNFRNFILNEQHPNIVKEGKFILLYELKQVILKYSQYQAAGKSSKTIDITRLRTTLAEAFQNRRKFLIDQPDDPVDCLFAFINAAHSYSIVIYFMIFLI